MNTYRTMTTDGGFGSSYLADNDDDAIAQAKRDGYEVLDVTDLGDSVGFGVTVLVIADSERDFDPGPQGDGVNAPDDLCTRSAHCNYPQGHRDGCQPPAFSQMGR